MDITRELRISATGRPYLGRQDLIDHIMDTASDIVTEANFTALLAGKFSAAQFAAKTAEAAAAMTRRICADAMRAGRPQVARAVLAAWDAAA